MANKHLIGKQVWELEVTSSKNTYAIQQSISELVWKRLLPELSKLFDGMVSENEIIRLDKIELDIGNITLKEVNIAEIIDKIVKALKEECIKQQVLEEYQIAGGRWMLPTKEAQPLRNHYFDIWLHWLQKGALPSYAIEPEKNWMELVLETLGLEHRAITRLEELLRKNPLALKRLVLQHTAKDLKSMVELYTGFSQTDLLQLFNELKLLIKGSSFRNKSISYSYRELEVVLWTEIFTKVILHRKKLDSWSLGMEISKQEVFVRITREFEKLAKTDKTPFLEKILGKGSTEQTKEAHSGILEDKIEKNELELDDEPLESPQFFTNAGIVLLNPFLKPLFAKLGFLEDSGFKDFESQCKAVLLLHFLATGEEQLPEYEMVLPKFLCAMPVNVPLDHALHLNKKEKKEALKLLQVVIDHWGALGNTSPDGLREGFLMREGKLEKGQAGWKLYVEQKAMDLLLDKLPWNISMIKLPWMKELLKAEWR